MFLDKIKNRTSGILIYSITPPKLNTPPEKVMEAGCITVARIQELTIDALIVYDVQDESTRTKAQRPYPFQPAIDPLTYTSAHLSSLSLPKIIYRPAGKYTPEELKTWFQTLQQYNCHPVLVGIPSPDYAPKSSLTEAYDITSQYQDTSVIGAIAIPERHVVLKDEQQRMLDKIRSGVSYFVTQCVFNVDYTIQLLKDFKSACLAEGQTLPTIVFTLSTCGSLKTLQFMEWLGIHFSEDYKARLEVSSAMLEDSVDICLSTAEQLAAYCLTESIPFGFNIESVSLRKDEIEASIALLKQVQQVLFKSETLH
ncbi:MAG TPA: hypothetical protein VL947_11320 [Cytophagales bacterium]|nr:hypothetical protein [Cytophagales bacterium]